MCHRSMGFLPDVLSHCCRKRLVFQVSAYGEKITNLMLEDGWFQLVATFFFKAESIVVGLRNI